MRISKQKLRSLGAKAYNLLRVNSIAYPARVPNFLVLQTKFFRNFEKTEKMQRACADLIKSFTFNSEAKSFAVRSSATAEDMKDASFAGVYESFINVPAADVPERVIDVWNSTRDYRAEDYCHRHNIWLVEMAVIIQEHVKTDFSGVLFTRHPDDESDEKVTYLNYVKGSGDKLVSGLVNGEELCFSGSVPTSAPISAPSLLQLQLLGMRLENLFGCPVDVEWGLFRNTLYLFQVRPITTKAKSIEAYQTDDEPVLKGTAIRAPLVEGTVQILANPKDSFEPGSILVCESTHPDWEPVIGKAKALITNHGAKTSHAALVARELGIPAVVGTLEATSKLRTGDRIKVDATGRDLGYVYKSS